LWIYWKQFIIVEVPVWANFYSIKTVSIRIEYVLQHSYFVSW